MRAAHVREIPLLLLLAAAPLLAYAPALQAGRLLAPGDGTALHLPLRVETWRAFARGELPSWNASAFCGTPLLAAYRPGALHPLMPLLALLPPLAAFQVLVVLSLALAGVLTYLCARRLGAEPVGALVAALSFALGPYLVARLGDTATVVAAPALPLLLIALERQLGRGGPRSRVLMALATALLALSGSPEALGAAALLVTARLAVALLAARSHDGEGGSLPARAAGVLPGLAAGLLLAAPQLVPTLIAWREAGPAGATPSAPSATLAGVAGLVVAQVSHTPAAVFALAGIALLPAWPALRGGLALLAVGLLLPQAEGRMDSGALPLALELALALVAGLSLSALWRSRTAALGRRLRRLALALSLAAVAALSVATTVTGPLDPFLAAPVGLLALGLILFFAWAESPRPVTAHVFLLPLVASFLLQPWGRHAWAKAPSVSELVEPTATREAVDRAMGERRAERTLTLLEGRPAVESAFDLAWANLATFAGRRNVNGFDPMVPERRRRDFEGMQADGTLPRALLQSDPGRLELLGVRWLQVPTAALAAPADADGLGDELGVVIEPPRPHLFAVPYTWTTEIRLVSFLAGSTAVAQGEVVAECVARLANGREIWVPIRAGVDTASGHQHRGVLRLPGRFAVTALRFKAWPGAPALWLLRAGLHDVLTGRSSGVSLASAHASDEVRLALLAETPRASLYEVRRGIGPAWVVPRLRRLPDEEHLREVLRAPTRLGVDAREEALATEEDAAGLVLPPGSRSSAADVARAVGGRLVVRAAGPGLLVVGEGWDPGWHARVDGALTEVRRVNGDRLGLVLQDGTHRVVLTHHARGLVAGVALAAAGVLLLGGWWWRGREGSG